MSSKGSSLRTAGGHALIYAAAVLMQRAISFAMLPVYTRFLTPADYGVSQLLDMTVDVAGILLVAGTVAGMQRLYFAAKDEREADAVISTTLLGVLAQGLAGTLLLCLLAPLIWQYGLSPAGSVNMIRLSALNFTLTLLPTVPLLVLQIERRPVLYATAMLVRLIIQLSFNILFVVGMHLGVWGILLSTTIASTVVGIGMTAWCFRRTGVHLDMIILRAIGRFGAPYRLAGIGGFILTFGDRFFLKAYHGVASVGLYALSYQFGFLLGQIGHVPVMNAWEPQRYIRARESEEALRLDTTRGFLLYNVVMLSIAVGLGCGARPVMRFLVGPEFRSAADIVPIVVAAYVFNGWYAVIKFGVDLGGKTRPIAYATWISVIATCLAYWLLIPPYGPAGAAWATLIGFVVRFAVLYPAAHRARPLPHGWPRVGAMASVCFALLALSAVIRPPTLVADAAASAGEELVFLVFVWIAILRTDDRLVLRTLGAGALRRMTGGGQATA
jgi:O-antigen/teichoic acid export membrane protein